MLVTLLNVLWVNWQIGSCILQQTSQCLLASGNSRSKIVYRKKKTKTTNERVRSKKVDYVNHSATSKNQNNNKKLQAISRNKYVANYYSKKELRLFIQSYLQQPDENN